MSVTTLALTVDLPDLDASVSWSMFESMAVAMREQVPAAALAETLERLQAELIDRVCGTRWLPVRGLDAPFACPRCGVMRDFARAGKRSLPRKFRTAVGEVSVQLWHVRCRDCGKVFAPLLLMLDVMGKRRTDRLTIDLAALASQMSFGRAAAISRGYGVPATKGQAHHAVADAAAALGALGSTATGHPVVLLDGTGVRAGPNPRGTSCNLAIGLNGRRGPSRRRQVSWDLLACTVDEPWTRIGEQLARLPAPALVVLDGEPIVTETAQMAWPGVAIQRCWWHLPRGLRQALFFDKARGPWLKDRVSACAQLLRDVVRDECGIDQAHERYDTFTASIAGHPKAVGYLAEAREHIFTCLDPELRQRLARFGGPELATSVLERVMRELNARTDIGGSRWSVAGLRDVLTVQLARTTQHPAWQHLRRHTHPVNVIPFQLKFNGA
jgi:hypothetical protein